MKLNDILEVEIIDVNHNGNGIAKINDIPIFVPKCNIGDIVKIKLTKINKKYIIGEKLLLEKEDYGKEKIKCPYYDKCGGCDTLHISYEEENELKKRYIGKLFNIKTEITSFDRFNYRNKVTLHVKDKKIGFYKENTNELIEIKRCLLLEEEINNLIKFLQKIDLSDIEEIIIKKGINGLLLSVTGNINNKDIIDLINYKDLISIYQNNLLIYGEPFIKNKFNDITYNINNNSFFQVNTKCANAMYQKAKEYIGSANKLLDLYCGMASIGIYLSDISNEIIGVEINKDSVKCGKKNIKENDIKNYKIINNDASFIKDNYDVVVVDPPRSGLSKEVIDILNDMKCEKIIYISCNPSTLKRDIDLLKNYELKDISVFNMFPGTKHIECVCKLELK